MLRGRLGPGTEPRQILAVGGQSGSGLEQGPEVLWEVGERVWEGSGPQVVVAEAGEGLG